MVENAESGSRISLYDNIRVVLTGLRIFHHTGEGHGGKCGALENKHAVLTGLRVFMHCVATIQCNSTERLYIQQDGLL